MRNEVTPPSQATSTRVANDQPAGSKKNTASPRAAPILILGWLRNISSMRSEVRNVPAAAERFDQGDVRDQLVLLHGEQRFLIGDQRLNVGYDRSVAHRARVELIERDVRRDLRILDRPLPELRRLREHPQREQLVLDGLKGGEDGLAVIG